MRTFVIPIFSMLSTSTGQAPGLWRGDGACAVRQHGGPGPEGPEGRVDDTGGEPGAAAGDEAGDGGRTIGGCRTKVVRLFMAMGFSENEVM
jgi:hypothetical protein